MLNGRRITGPMLLELCKSYVNAINKGSVPCIESAWSYVLKHESEKLINHLINEYNQFVKNLLPKSSDESIIGILNQLHDEITPKLIDKFNESAINDEIRENESKLVTAIEEAYKNFMYHAKIKEQSKCENFLKCRLEDLERSLRKGEFESMNDFNKSLRSLQSEYASKFPNFDRETSTNIWRSATERIILKAGEYISRNISDKAKSESDLLKLQLKTLQASYSKLSSELESEKSKKLSDIREVEKKNATLKSTVKIIEEKFIITEKVKVEEIKQIRQKMAELKVHKIVHIYRKSTKNS